MSEILTPESLIARNEAKFLASNIGEETVMMNIDNGDYIGINGMGSEIWTKLGQTQTVKALITDLVDDYEVSTEVCQTEILEYLNRLLKQQIITIAA